MSLEAGDVLRWTRLSPKYLMYAQRLTNCGMPEGPYIPKHVPKTAIGCYMHLIKVSRKRYRCCSRVASFAWEKKFRGDEARRRHKRGTDIYPHHLISKSFDNNTQFATYILDFVSLEKSELVQSIPQICLVNSSLVVTLRCECNPRDMKPRGC